MISSLNVAAFALLVFASTAACAQTQTSRGAQIILEGVNATARSAIVEAGKDLSRRTADGTVKTDTPLARSCNFLLGDALHLHDEQRLLDTSFHALRFREWMCQSGFRTRDELTDSTTALDMADPGLGATLGYVLRDDRATFTRQLDQFCAAGYELYVDPAARENFERQARASMTDAYKTCLDTSVDAAAGKSGAFAYATPRDRSLQSYTVNMRWAPNAADKQIAGVQTDGARCTSASRKGDPNLKLDCTRTTDGTGVVTIATARGKETVLLPGQVDMARVTLEERLLILRDRIHFLEQGLSEKSPGLLADLRDALRE